MTTMTTLNDVRTALIAQGYPVDQVDAMLNLAGRMVLEGSLASKDDVNGIQDEFTLFKIDVAERFAELRIEMNEKFAEIDVKFAELRTEMNARFAEQNAAADERERRIIKWGGGIGDRRHCRERSRPRHRYRDCGIARPMTVYGLSSMTIVDTHVHIGRDHYEPVEILLAQMELNGVAKTVLVQSTATLDNSYVLECRQRFPGRLGRGLPRRCG